MPKKNKLGLLVCLIVGLLGNAGEALSKSKQLEYPSLQEILDDCKRAVRVPLFARNS
jgi:hypothetical protein